VTSRVTHVEKGSPADKAGVEVNDEIREIRQRIPGVKPGETRWSSWVKMASKRGKKEVYDQWAHYFWNLPRGDFQDYQIKVARNGSEKELVQIPEGDEKALTAELDGTWPLAPRGLHLIHELRRQKAGGLVEALRFGVDRTLTDIKTIYLNLSSLLSGRISTKSLGGPIEIAAQAFSAADDWLSFTLFLAVISINLAVVNFLPIPVLDGGHMVFLVYEKLRGKPPSETVRAVATYLGLAIILSLMLFVFWLDFKRRIWS
jgi:regulator of sigma E protease